MFSSLLGGNFEILKLLGHPLVLLLGKQTIQMSVEIILQGALCSRCDDG